MTNWARMPFVSELVTSSHATDPTNRSIQGLFRLGRQFANWRPPVKVLPRHECRFVVLDMDGVPIKLVESALALQLKQLTGCSEPGFAFRVDDGQASVWYWDETPGRSEAGGRLGRENEARCAPWPETLLKVFPSQNVVLAKCVEGVEALVWRDGRIYRARWFATAPSETQWTAFLRDGGMPDREPAHVQTLPLRGHPPAGWRLHSRHLRPMPATWWGAAAAGLFGAILIVFALVYEFKLDRAIAQERAIVSDIGARNAGTIALQERISDISDFVVRLGLEEPKVSQIGLMSEMAASGLFDETGAVSLMEWEYRSGRLRMLFALPAESGPLQAFLEKIETVPSLEQIRLLPDSPPRTVAVQARVIPRNLPVAAKVSAPPVLGADTAEASGAPAGEGGGRE